MKLNYWDIPRSDKRNRCANPECLKVIKKGQMSFYTKKYLGYRFTNLCHGCALQDKLESSIIL